MGDVEEAYKKILSHVVQPDATGLIMPSQAIFQASQNELIEGYRRLPKI